MSRERDAKKLAWIKEKDGECFLDNGGEKERRRNYACNEREMREEERDMLACF